MSKHPTRQPLNIVHRLRDRQLQSGPYGTAVSFSRRLYDCLAPQTVAQGVELFEDHICKFVSYGEYLVCFGNMLRDVVIYRYTGLEGCQQGDGKLHPLPLGLSFHRFFQLKYRKTLAHGAEVLNKDFCLIAHRDEYLILASATPPCSNVEEALPEGSPIQNVPVYASTTFHLLRLADGCLCDQYSITFDCVHLSSNNGVFLYEDLLAILAIHAQTIHLLQVLPSGRFVKVHQFGKLCWDDDELVLSEQTHVEELWRSARGLSVPKVEDNQALRQFSGAPIAALQREAGLQLVVRNQLPPPAALEEDRLQAHGLAEAPVEDAPTFERAGSAAAALQLGPSRAPSLLTGITHCILAFLFLERRRHGASSEALRRFFNSFDDYATLVVWKVQFLDRNFLLLSVGPSNATQARSNNAYFLVVYDRQTGTVVDFHDNKSESLHRLYLQHTPCFHAACMDSLWTRYITPCPASLHLHANADAYFQGHSQTSHNQMIRRVLANLPAMAQALSPSPFLDYNLFSYDDKLISPVLRMRAYSEQPLKFSSRAHPTGYRFKVQPHDGVSAAQPGRPVKQLVAYHFHPVQPFVLCLLHTALHPPQMTVFFRE